MTEQQKHCLQLLPDILIKERGAPSIGVAFWRWPREGETIYWKGSVGEFLSNPENQSGRWLIDGGWGDPPGPIYVGWNGTQWENGGFGIRRFDELAARRKP